MLHANVCKANYATRAGETVVKKLLYDTNTPKGKTCALKSADKDPKLLDKPKRVWYADKKSGEQAFDFVALKTAHGRRFESGCRQGVPLHRSRILQDRRWRLVLFDGGHGRAGEQSAVFAVFRIRK